jgi:hypothetical protein
MTDAPGGAARVHQGQAHLPAGLGNLERTELALHERGKGVSIDIFLDNIQNVRLNYQVIEAKNMLM